MTRIDRIFILTTSAIVLSIPGLHFLIISTEKQEITVEVLERELVKNPTMNVVVPGNRFSGGRAGKMEIPQYWILKVKVDGEMRSLNVSPSDEAILNSQFLDLRYQYLRDGSFRVISFERAENPPGT